MNLIFIHATSVALIKNDMNLQKASKKALIKEVNDLRDQVLRMNLAVPNKYAFSKCFTGFFFKNVYLQSTPTEEGVYSKTGVSIDDLHTLGFVQGAAWMAEKIDKDFSIEDFAKGKTYEERQEHHYLRTEDTVKTLIEHLQEIKNN
jgi:hypothetical protein